MHRFPLSRRHTLLVVALALAGLLLAGRHFASRPATGAKPVAQRLAPVVARATPKLVVHVVGAVRRPGLYRLSSASRISDAVARAGGATPRADLALVNLAAPLADGTQVVVPGRVPPVSDAADAPSGRTVAAGPVHLNTATLAELEALPGVGPITAQKIIDFRRRHGAFSSVDELDAIPGFGPARLEQLREAAAP